eukprot:TRINITY_DN1765_c0_g1_i2.p1 TRINITY_DN1765_c0_g1~~TRINITY_DN1765_c0_g1_i2.p1  ORF type:complete len:964 (+),score=147.57 TRINITY_DN1765_c0_g1_i2:363-3254(+)
MAQGVAYINITMVRPKTGYFNLTVTSSSSDLGVATLAVTVTPGPPRYIGFINEATRNHIDSEDDDPVDILASAQTLLSDSGVLLCALDTSFSPSRALTPISVSYHALPSISGSAAWSSVIIPPGVDCLDLSSLSLRYPLAGTYKIIAAGAGSLGNASFSVRVLAGMPASMKVIVPPSPFAKSRLLAQQPTFMFADVANNILSGLHASSVDIVMLGVLYRVPIDSATGHASFDDANIPYTPFPFPPYPPSPSSLPFESNFTMTFYLKSYNYTVSSSPSSSSSSYDVPASMMIMSSFPVILAPCSAITALTIPSNDGSECLCQSGYYMEPLSSSISSSSSDNVFLFSSFDNHTGGDISTNYRLADASSLSVCYPCPLDTFNPYSGKRSVADCFHCPETQEATDVGQSLCVCKSTHFNKYNSTSQQYNDDCTPCPRGTVCKSGRIIGVKSGFWLEPGFWLNIEEHVFECDNAQSCQYNGTCSAGYVGVLCLLCDRDGGYGASGNACQPCPARAANWAVLIVALLAMLCFLVYLVIAGKRAKNKDAVSMKILLNHLQVLSMLSAVGALWAEPFEGVLRASGVFSFFDMRLISTDCIVEFGFYYRFGFYVLIPLLTFIISTIVHFFIYLYFLIRKVKTKAEARHAVITQFVLSVVMVNFILYPAISLKVLEVFSCREIGKLQYLTSDPSIVCEGSTYQFWTAVAYVMLIVFCMGLPLGLFGVLYYTRRRPQAHYALKVIMHFFSDGFKVKHYYWEIVILLRKFLIVVMLMVFSKNSQYQLLGILWVIIISVLVHSLLRPFNSGRLRLLEMLSLMVSLATLACTLYINDAKYKNMPLPPDGDISLSFVVTLINALLCLVFIFFVARSLIRTKFVKCWDFLRSISKQVKKRSHSNARVKENDLERIQHFLGSLASSHDVDAKDQVLQNLDVWWERSANYQRRRLLKVLQTIVNGGDDGMGKGHVVSSLAN